MREGWEIGEIGGVCEILNGGTPKTGIQEYWDGDIFWITPKDMGKLQGKYVSDTPRKISLLGLQKSSAKIIPPNSIILSTRAPIGHLAINEQAMATNQGCRGIIPSKAVDTQYLFYFLSNSVDLLNALGTGATFRELSTRALSRVKIPLPSLPEQQRIVSILDRAFVAIDKAKANAEQNLKNARELFESYLQGVFEKKGDGWVTLTLSELLEKGWILSHLDGNHGGDYPRKEEFVDSGVPYISANCIKGTNIDFSRSKFLSSERALSIRKGVAINNDVLFAHNATVGPVALLKTSEDKVILGTSLTYYRCNTNYILPTYLANFMRSKEFKSQYKIIMRQSTRNQVPITKQREFHHIIPPVKFQKKIVSILELLLEQSQKLENQYQKKVEYFDNLKESILQKAFSGELSSIKEPVP